LLVDENDDPGAEENVRAVVSATKKPKKGVFKNSGSVLTEGQQEVEFTQLNPMSRAHFNMPGSVRVPTKKHSYIHGGKKASSTA
jgi:hypothetical protein